MMNACARQGGTSVRMKWSFRIQCTVQLSRYQNVYQPGKQAIARENIAEGPLLLHPHLWVAVLDVPVHGTLPLGYVTNRHRIVKAARVSRMVQYLVSVNCLLL